MPNGDQLDRRSYDNQMGMLTQKVDDVLTMLKDFKSDQRRLCEDRGQEITILEAHVGDKLPKKTFEDFYKDEFRSNDRTTFRHRIYFGVLLTVGSATFAFLMFILHNGNLENLLRRIFL